MFLSKFDVSGFRSLRSVALENLGKVNVFYGENGVGKSNLLRALELFGRLLASKQNPAGKSSKADGFRTHLFNASTLANLGFSGADFTWGHKPFITMCGTFVEDLETSQETIEVKLTISADREKSVEVDWGPREQPAIRALKNKLGSDGIFRIPSHRRLEQEELRNEVGGTLDALGSDLKRRLFWASVSPDLDLKDRYWKRMVPLLRDEPLSLGEPVSVGTSTESVDVRFKRDHGEVSVSDLGSGIEQLLLILGLSTLCDARILAIEEPEMNLSWVRQQTLQKLLHKMIASQSGAPRQLFISSHSPIFAEDPFFDVTMEDRETQVTRLAKKHLSYFGEEVPSCPEGEVGKLLFGNFVRFPDSVISRLGLEPGQLVFFQREEDRMTILTEAEMDQYLAAGREAEPKP